MARLDDADIVVLLPSHSVPVRITEKTRMAVDILAERMSDQYIWFYDTEEEVPNND